VKPQEAIARGLDHALAVSMAANATAATPV
jgi:hypothetical protein